MARDLYEKCNNTADGGVVTTAQMDARMRQTETTKRSKATKHLFEAVIIPYLQGMGYNPPSDFKTKVVLGSLHTRTHCTPLPNEN